MTKPKAKKAPAKKKPSKKVISQPKPKLQMFGFYATLDEAKMRQSATNLDVTFSLKLRTNDPAIMDLGKLPAMTLFKVDMRVVDTSVITKKGKEDKLYE